VNLVDCYRRREARRGGDEEEHGGRVGLKGRGRKGWVSARWRGEDDQRRLGMATATGKSLRSSRGGERRRAQCERGSEIETLGIIDGPGGLDSGDRTSFWPINIHIPVSHQIKSNN
jgi:hypothetical protein